MGIPTGIVTIYSGSVPLTTVTLDNSGHANYSTSSLPAGTLTLVALYSGDSNFSSSTATLAQQVNPISTTSSLSSSLNPSSFSQGVTFSSMITSATGLIPTGSVTFFDGAQMLGTSTLNNLGVATFTTLILTPTSHLITATYNPDADFITSSSNLTQVVSQAPTSTTILTSSPNPANPGDLITFVASTSSATGIPTGTPHFF